MNAGTVWRSILALARCMSVATEPDEIALFGPKRERALVAHVAVRDE